VQTADKIIILQQGKLVEEGTHASLMSSEGKYYSLWQQQMPIVSGNRCLLLVGILTSVPILKLQIIEELTYCITTLVCKKNNQYCYI